MPGIFLTTNIFAHVGVFFYPDFRGQYFAKSSSTMHHQLWRVPGFLPSFFEKSVDQGTTTECRDFSQPAERAHMLVFFYPDVSWGTDGYRDGLFKIKPIFEFF